MGREKLLEELIKQSESWKKRKEKFEAYVNDSINDICAEFRNDKNRTERVSLYEYLIEQNDKEIESKLVEMFNKKKISDEQLAQLLLILDRNKRDAEEGVAKNEWRKFIC